MKILFAGTTAGAAKVLEHLARNNNIVAVLTREDAPAGRKAIMKSSAVATTADSLGLPIIKANRITEATDLVLKATGFELGVVVAYGTLLKQRTLDLAPRGWYNLHFSLLPAFRGAAPVQHALLAGTTETGVSLFRLDSGMDTGPIIGQVSTMIEPDENAGELLHRLTHIGISLLDENLPRLAAGTAVERRQPSTGTAAPKVNRQHARISFKDSARQIENLVRACNPEPMAWCELGDESLRVLEARASLLASELAIGEVRIEKNRVLVGTGNGTQLELLEVQPAGKKPMPALAWARGLREQVILK